MKNKNLKIGAVLYGLLLLLAGCGDCCSHDHSNLRGHSHKKTGLVVINVLDQELYNDCHIKDSINIPFEMIEKNSDTIDKNAQVVFYCSDYQCTSSEWAAKKFKEKGFHDVSVYEGGMAEWYQKGLPTEGPHEKPYLNKTVNQVLSDEQSEIPLISCENLAEKMNVAA